MTPTRLSGYALACFILTIIAGAIGLGLTVGEQQYVLGGILILLAIGLFFLGLRLEDQSKELRHAEEQAAKEPSDFDPAPGAEGEVIS